MTHVNLVMIWDYDQVNRNKHERDENFNITARHVPDSVLLVSDVQEYDTRCP